ncbi:MAG: amidohydrolase [Steroidobacteraceae bacterium]
MRRIAVFTLALCASLPAAAKPDYAAAIAADYQRSLGALWDHFHRNPELSYRETKTAARMAQELRAIPGMKVTEGVGGTGVVAVLQNGDGPTVLVRADMDGLPLAERSGVANPSKVRQVGIDGVEAPVMHACGHAVHITSQLATARQLAALRERWRGTVVFVVQPAEERFGGAAAMLADGLYSRFPKPDYALASHVTSSLPTGTISASESVQYSSADNIDITVFGVGTHGAAPQAGRDPVYIASQIVVALQSLISREKGPLEPGVITVGAFHAGSKHNIISERADLQLTVRANSRATRDALIAGIERVARNTALALGVAEDRLPLVKIVESTPPTLNDPALARRLNTALAAALGPGVVQPFEQTSMGAEDFTHCVEPSLGVPGYYFAVGGTPQAVMDAAAAGGPPLPPHHSPLFRIDPEPAVRTGAEAMVTAVLELLAPR